MLLQKLIKTHFGVALSHSFDPSEGKTLPSSTKLEETCLRILCDYNGMQAFLSFVLKWETSSAQQTNSFALLSFSSQNAHFVWYLYV